jgi:hypothetical protein
MSKNHLAIFVSMLLFLSACTQPIPPTVSEPPAPTITPTETTVSPLPTETASPEVLSGGTSPLPPSFPPTPENSLEVQVFQSGPFLFDFRIYRDPVFQQNPPMVWMYSDLTGIGSYVSWIYHGPEFQGPVVERWGLCPDVQPIAENPVLRDGNFGVREGGFALPSRQPGDRVWFVYELETPQGTFGGCFGFTLRQGDQGLEPADITIRPLNPEGQNCGCSE